MSKLIDKGKGRRVLMKTGEGDPAAISAAPTLDHRPPLPVEVPRPRQVEDPQGPLSPEEQDRLKACEAAIHRLKQAFVAAGRALQAIRDEGLYRDPYPSFEAYLRARWDMSRAQAYRLIDAWSLAEKLSPTGDISQRQVRALVPLAKAHGEGAAVAVYQTAVEIDPAKVTGDLLEDVVAILPRDRWDEQQATARVRAYLQGEYHPEPDEPTPADEFTAHAKVIRRSLQQATGVHLADVARTNPADLQALAADLRTYLAEIESALGASDS
ncbi:hypothetical protein [Actinomadura kijaniata]|uniref:hypothetical protein n=1 Tax=Actinomadura kijaniata TaxID=46161 RepID=UPI00082D83DC|nr:hypothetical protein [Actinomadura kijaniata]